MVGVGWGAGVDRLSLEASHLHMSKCDYSHLASPNGRGTTEEHNLSPGPAHHPHGKPLQRERLWKLWAGGGAARGGAGKGWTCQKLKKPLKAGWGALQVVFQVDLRGKKKNWGEKGGEQELGLQHKGSEERESERERFCSEYVIEQVGNKRTALGCAPAVPIPLSATQNFAFI